MTANQNSKSSPDTVKSNHHSWVKGVSFRGKKVFHPYTLIDFKFGNT